MSHPEQIHVAVGVIFNPKGQVLIAKRPDHVHQGGLWEFPGGKLEPTEDISRALHRELEEELGITVISATPLIRINHTYENRRVLLDVWKIVRFQGQARGLEKQPIRWVWPEQLDQYSFPQANNPIITALRLPEFYPILDDECGDRIRMQENVEGMLKSGIKMIRLRAKKLDDLQYRRFALDICRICSERQVNVLLNSIPDLVYETNAAGLHLTSRELMEITRRPLDPNYWVAASCHNLQELKQAEAVGVDFVVLSPVLPTPSHQDIRPIGWDGFESMVLLTNLPVYALGGMAIGRLKQAKSRGAQGISAIRAFIP